MAGCYQHYPIVRCTAGRADSRDARVRDEPAAWLSGASDDAGQRRLLMISRNSKQNRSRRLSNFSREQTYYTVVSPFIGSVQYIKHISSLAGVDTPACALCRSSYSQIFRYTAGTDTRYSVRSPGRTLLDRAAPELS